MKSSTIKKIVEKYYSLDFPGSYGGINTFKEALKAHLNIDVSQRALRKILRNEVHYQVHYPKKSLFSRTNYARGSNLEAFGDTVYMRYGKDNEKQIVFLLVVDVFNRYLYGEVIKEGKVNPVTMEKAWKTLFRKGMPKFPVIRVDRDKSTLTLRSMFAKKRILLQVLRGPHFMGLLDTCIRVIENKLSRHLFKYPNANLDKALAQACTSWNSGASDGSQG